MSGLGKGFYKKFLPPEVADWVRKTFLFKPNDAHNLYPAPQSARLQVKDVPRIKGYRYPAPASQPKASVPVVVDEDKLYDNKYFSRDVPRSTRIVLQLYPKKYDKVVEMTENPKNEMVFKHHDPFTFKNADLAKYDPSGLRGGTNITWAEYEKEINKNAPSHLPQPNWCATGGPASSGTSVLVDAQRKGLPPVPGRFEPHLKVPLKDREATW